MEGFLCIKLKKQYILKFKLHIAGARYRLHKKFTKANTTKKNAVTILGFISLGRGVVVNNPR